MAVLGIDLGSSFVKTALLDGEGFELLTRPSGWAPNETAESSVVELLARRGLAQSDVEYTVATGYGRANYPRADKTVTEITCHAAGARWLAPATETVLDIGGQDSKVIVIGPDGGVRDFLMNDKCAAGTGRFLQNMAALLGCRIEDFAEVPADAPVQTISSMCTVFAESEVISLISKGVPRESVILGLLDSIARRAANMVERMSQSGPVTFTGGAAGNEILASLISRQIGREVTAPRHHQCAGAIGAAVIAARKIGRFNEREEFLL